MEHTDVSQRVITGWLTYVTHGCQIHTKILYNSHIKSSHILKIVHLQTLSESSRLVPEMTATVDVQNNDKMICRIVMSAESSHRSKRGQSLNDCIQELQGQQKQAWACKIIFPIAFR